MENILEFIFVNKDSITGVVIWMRLKMLWLEKALIARQELIHQRNNSFDAGSGF